MLIVSSKEGYKLPASVQDLINHINHSGLTLIPMIKRLGIYRQAILSGTLGEIDIFGFAPCDYLKKAYEALANYKDEDRNL